MHSSTKTTKFLLDNNLPRHLARALNQLSVPEYPNISIQHLTDNYHPATLDHEWISDIANSSEKWVVISQDKFVKNQFEIQALKSSGLTFFILRKGWARTCYWDKAVNLFRWWPSIVQKIENSRRPEIVYVPWGFSGKGKFEKV